MSFTYTPHPPVQQVQYFIKIFKYKLTVRKTKILVQFEGSTVDKLLHGKLDPDKILCHRKQSYRML